MHAVPKWKLLFRGWYSCERLRCWNLFTLVRKQLHELRQQLICSERRFKCLL